MATLTFATDGTLLYWLGHDVQRGTQPRFYYLVLMPQYDFIAVMLGFGAAVAIALKALRVMTRRHRTMVACCFRDCSSSGS
ncbi:MAG: hypothetical protein R2845_14360 [Thermomicrobiales bacterium]